MNTNEIVLNSILCIQCTADWKSHAGYAMKLNRRITHGLKSLGPKHIGGASFLEFTSFYVGINLQKTAVECALLC